MTPSEKRGLNPSIITQTSEFLGVHKNTLLTWGKRNYLKVVLTGLQGDRHYKRNDVMNLAKGKNE